MVASGQITGGNWPATLVGLVLLTTFVATMIRPIKCKYRRHRDETLRHDTVGLSGLLVSDRDTSLWRCRGLTAEALIVRQRLSGDIDAEAYRARMNDLARKAARERGCSAALD
ncbi:hypothetical protein [Mycobacterium kansasii]|uniref:hypothetical protein n=1 Tax=Mycobacterium kansasii TaxID=1768 RepID=UPI000CDDE022|nr:hypothetical protein [Mycobacterium kansasii]POX83768.1 hypothetical protein C3B43_24425 [Mycobacterium kansasii]